MAMYGAARRQPAMQMAISHPGVITPDGSAFRGLPGVPMTLPREVGKLLCPDGKIIDKKVASSNIGRTLISSPTITPVRVAIRFNTSNDTLASAWD